MQLKRVGIDGHRSVQFLEFDASPLTVLFGKNNVGKSNILETIHGIIEPGGEKELRRELGRASTPHGYLCFSLSPDCHFDRVVNTATSADGFDGYADDVMFTDKGFISRLTEKLLETEYLYEPDDFENFVVDSPRLSSTYLNWDFNRLRPKVEAAIAEIALIKSPYSWSGPGWLEPARSSDGSFSYKVNDAIERRLLQLSRLASDLLPDFVKGRIDVQVTSPTLWEQIPKVSLEYDQVGLTQCADSVGEAGHGAARWMAAAIQIALKLMKDDANLYSVRSAGAFSGHVLLIDEPEAHLHAAAVTSMVRWCERMVWNGFTLIVATHNEEFLRIPPNAATLVHVTRSADLVLSDARTLTMPSTSQLQELAEDVGMHPSTTLSLHKAILFVEGPLDVAVLDEFAGARLDAAGVKLIPVHGTKNLEGLITAEVVTDLGIRIGILTDATDPATMPDRARRKLSSEERKVQRVRQLMKDRGLDAPTLFGVKEDDLLFALPVEDIRRYLDGPFPQWKELVRECRASLQKSPSDSVNWKEYARDKYGLPIDTPHGVRSLVRALDLSGAELLSIDTAIRQVCDWARSIDSAS